MESESIATFIKNEQTRGKFNFKFKTISKIRFTTTNLKNWLLNEKFIKV